MLTLGNVTATGFVGLIKPCCSPKPVGQVPKEATPSMGDARTDTAIMPVNTRNRGLMPKS
jgi:hypothetical protein